MSDPADANAADHLYPLRVSPLKLSSMLTARRKHDSLRKNIAHLLGSNLFLHFLNPNVNH